MEYLSFFEVYFDEMKIKNQINLKMGSDFLIFYEIGNGL
jgi:hypothetical protein